MSKPVPCRRCGNKEITVSSSMFWDWCWALVYCRPCSVAGHDNRPGFDGCDTSHMTARREGIEAWNNRNVGAEGIAAPQARE